MEELRQAQTGSRTAPGQQGRDYLGRADAYLSKSESRALEFRKFWYLNQSQLGDILKCKEAYKCITLTLNNLGLVNK